MAQPTSGAKETGLSGALSSLRDRQFRWLWIGNSAFFFAMQALSMIIRPTLAYQLTGQSAAALGAVTTAVAVPMLVLSPFGGVLADRVDRRRIIRIGQGVVMLGEGTMLALFGLGLLRFWHLLMVGLMMGTMFALMMPSRQAIVVNIVGKARLGNAMALNMAAMNVTRVVAPALAGLLIATQGIAVTYASCVALYGIAWLTLLAIDPSPPAGGERLPVLRSIGEGLTYLGQHRVVLLMLLFGLIPMFLMMPFQPLLLVFAHEVWEQGDTGLGLLNAMAGVGGVAGSFVVATRGEGGKRLRLMIVSSVGFGGFLLFFANSPWFVPGLLLLLLANVFSTIFGVLNNTAVQQLIPDEVRGRISAFLMASFSLPMLGALPVTIAAERFGAPLAISVASLAAILITLAFQALSPTLRGLDQAVDRAMSDGE